MSVRGPLSKRADKPNKFRSSTILMITVVAISCMIPEATLVSADEAADRIESANHAWSFIDEASTAAALASGVQAMPRPAPAEGANTLPWRRVLKEVAKQAVDQPGHFVVAAIPIWASRHLVGVPWYGWAIAPLLAYREWLQWPSNRWWDPPLDWIFLTLGAVVATCRRGPTPRLPTGLPALQRRISSWRVARPAEGAPDLVHAHAEVTAGTARRRRWVNAAAEAGFRR
jgi:hypothetical protein